MLISIASSGKARQSFMTASMLAANSSSGPNVSNSLSSLGGCYVKSIIGLIKGATRSLDYGS